jgi:beta-lactamase superfamily II metal-dependent hydrolase
MEPLAEDGTQVFRTDRDGTVVVVADDPPRVVTED